MRSVFVWLLVLAMLLSGCGGQAPMDETAASVETAPVETTSVAETEATTVPTEPPVYRNPLNGEILEEPYTGRIFAHTITNTRDALPHVNAVKADILVEAYVSRGVVRCLGLYTNIGEVEAIGGTRSTRMMFNRIARLYDAVLIHGGGSGMVLKDARHLELDHFNVDSLYRQADPLAKKVAYRDKEYRRYAPNDLFGYGPGIVEYVQAQGVRITQPADKEYYLNFVDDATPVDGEPADEITIHYGLNTKTTTMVYDPSIGKYVYHQYGKVMTDQITGEVEAFNNVLVLDTAIYEEYIYTVPRFRLGGKGYYACGGKIVPILWESEDGKNPIRCMTLDGEPLNVNVGNTYMSIIGLDKEYVEWKEGIPPETVPVETAAETLAEITEETVSETTEETLSPMTEAAETAGEEGAQTIPEV